MIRSFPPGRARSRLRILLAAAAVAAVAAAVAACGSYSANHAGLYEPAPSSAPASRATGTGGPALALRQTTVGTILTTGHGFTVYAFEADHGTASACTGACAAAWPPVTTSGTRVMVVGGALRSLVGETTRPGGAHQLTYAGHPLYTFAGDANPGAANGQGSQAFGARWDVLNPAGREVIGD
jgi:predicted lipoprotein with Yx(FWY)xxD motif